MGMNSRMTKAAAKTVMAIYITRLTSAICVLAVTVPIRAPTNIGVSVVGREVCLSGRMYDVQSIEQLRKRVEGFVKDFPGMSVNTDELRIYKQKILIDIEFVAYNDTMTRNLGFSGPEAITAGAEINFGYDHKKELSGDRTYNRAPSSGSTSAIIMSGLSCRVHRRALFMPVNVTRINPSLRRTTLILAIVPVV